MAVLAVIGACAEAGTPVHSVVVELLPGGLTVGDPAAAVILLEFGAFDCAACAVLHLEIYPATLHDRITTGQVRYRYIDLSRAGWGRELLESVACGVRRGEGMGAFAQAFRYGPSSGSESAPDSCLHDETIRAERAAARELGVYATPTLIIGYEDDQGQVIGWPLIGLRDGHELDTVLNAAYRRLSLQDTRRTNPGDGVNRWPRTQR